MELRSPGSWELEDNMPPRVRGRQAEGSLPGLHHTLMEWGMGLNPSMVEGSMGMTGLSLF